jgi:hypothetical protein
MAVTCCPLSGGDDWPATVFSSSVRRAAKEHRCCECRETIKVGDHYEHVTGLWDGHWSTYKTCLLCVEIRTHFACDGWIFGQLWEDLESNFFPDMKAGGPCMEGLSPAAKGRLFERRLAWLEANRGW